MKNAITTLRIQNFKSIKDVTMTPRRVNIIIGEPNVGKSNILEAMSLLGGMVYESAEKFMSTFLRYDKLYQLFYDNITANAVRIVTNRDKAILTQKMFDEHLAFLYINSTMEKNMYELIKDSHIFYEEEKEEVLLDDIAKKINSGDGLSFSFGEGYLEYSSLNMDGELRGPGIKMLRGSQNKRSSDVLPYLFQKSNGNIDEKRYYSSYLRPPNGNNLKEIIQSRKVLRQEVAQLFNNTGHKLLLRMESDNMEVVKEVDDVIYSYPYTSTADTLQRLIFYLAAIESNDDAVLLFEEPEAHSYPVYVSHLAQRIVESRNNQFFVVTHSPYFITEVLEEMLTNDELKPELAIFVAYYEDYQTKVRQLSDEEVYNIRRDGLDVFYNMARFVPQR